MRVCRLGSITLVAAFLLLASSTGAVAGKALYQGEWIAESFGNDRVGIGTLESLYFEALGIPQAILCHPAAPLCDFASTPVTTTGPGTAFAPLGPGCSRWSR